MTRESVFSTAIRSFFKAFFGILGFCFGLFAMILLIASLSDSSPSEPEAVYTAEIVPNANGDRKALSKKAPVILKLNIKGTIGSESLNMATIRKQLIESREGSFKNGRIKALLLDIQSPGGTVTDSDTIYRLIMAYKEQHKIPVYAYVDGLCASGGMYVASAADKIFASESSLIGSIGVVSSPFLNFYDLMKKVGVESLTISAGKDKDALNPLRQWRPDEQDNMQLIVKTYYDQFLNIVLKGRPKLTREDLVEKYGAKVFPATKAEEIGLIDVANTDMNATIGELKTKIGIEDDYYQVIQMEKKNWVTELVTSYSPLFTGKMTHSINFLPNMDSRMMDQYLYLYQPGN